MPGFNQTGPFGEGPMTGRKMGRCTNYGAKAKNQESVDNKETTESNQEDFVSRRFGFGRGFGRRRRGNGLGRQNRFRGGF